MTNPKIDNSGTKRWYNDKGELHREDGPAVIWTDGDQFWYLNGDLHNENGPAATYGDGYKEYWIVGIILTEQQFLQHKIKNFISNNNNHIQNNDGYLIT